MAFAPNTSPFITTALDNVDLPNSQVLAAGAGLQIVASGPGGNITINPTQNLLSLTNIAADGILSINHSTNTIFTRTLSSDGTLTIANANGVGGSPLFSVTPQSQVQLIQVSANGGSIVGAAPTINFSGAGNTSVSAVNEGSFINVVISSAGGGGGGGVTEIDTNNGLTGGPITTTGTIGLANPCYTPGNLSVTGELSITDQYVFPATQGSTGQVIASAGGTATAWYSITGTANEITASPITGAISLSLPSAMTVPGSLTSTTSITAGTTLSTPVFNVTGTPQNPWTVAPGAVDQVLTCNPITGELSWINNGSGGSGVTSVGLMSPNGTLNTTGGTNPVTSTGTIHADLTSQSSAGSYTNANITINAYGIVTAASNGSGGGGVSSVGISNLTTPSLTITNTPITGSGNIGVNFTTGLNQFIIPNNLITNNNSNDLVTIGHDAGANLDTATDCVFIGEGAGSSTTTGNYNIFIGSGAGADNVGGNDNVSVGTGAGNYTVGGSANNFFGTSAGFGPGASDSNNNAFGYFALGTGTTSGGMNFNSAFGDSAGKNLVTGSYNIFLGANANASFDAVGSGQLAIGDSNLTSLYIMGMGLDYGVTVSNGLTISDAGNTYKYTLPTTNGSTGNVLTWGPGGVATWVAGGGVASIAGTEYQILANATYGTPETGAITLAFPATGPTVFPNGIQTNTGGIGGGSNVAIGPSALANVVHPGAHNIGIGYQAGAALGGAVGNVYVGYEAGNLSTNSYNVGVGYGALVALTGGGFNIAIGNVAGETLTTGSNCSFIGNQAYPTSATVSNQIVLGNTSVTSFLIPGIGLDFGVTVPTGLTIGDHANTYSYTLPITSAGSSGLFLQSTGTGGQCVWASASGGGGISSLTGTASEILVNGTSGTPVTTASTLTLPSTLIAPGTFAATTSVTTPVLSMSGTGYTYNLPVTTGTAPTNGYFLQYQSAGGGQCVWAAGGGGGGGVTSVATNNGLTGGTITATGTIGLASPCYTPGNLSVTGELSITGQYVFPATQGSTGQVIASAGGTATAWYSVQAGGTYHSGILVSPTTGAIDIGWDPSSNVILPASLEVNATGTPYSLPTTAGTPGSTLRWPQNPTSGVYQLYWEAPYIVTGVTSTDFVITNTPTYTGSPFFDSVVSLTTSGTIPFPGNVIFSYTSGPSLTINGGALTVTGSQPLNPWPTLPISTGIVVSDTSGNISYNTSYALPTTITGQSVNWTFTGSGSSSFVPIINSSLTGTTATLRLDVSAYVSSGITCDGGGVYITLQSSDFTDTSGVLYFPTNSDQANTFLGSVPVYQSTGTVQSFYSYWYLVKVSAGTYQLVCSLGLQDSAALGTFSNGNVYFFGTDGNTSSPASALTFTYAIHP